MRITIDMETDNAAFEEGFQEKKRILRSIANRVAEGELDGRERDVNGNTVARFEVEITK